MTGKNALGAQVETTTAPTALAQDGFSCEINRSYARKYTRNGVQRTTKEAVPAFVRPTSQIESKALRTVVNREAISRFDRLGH